MRRIYEWPTTLAGDELGADYAAASLPPEGVSVLKRVAPRAASLFLYAAAVRPIFERHWCAS
jgi:hypothetical protein